MLDISDKLRQEQILRDCEEKFLTDDRDNYDYFDDYEDDYPYDTREEYYE